MIDCYIALGSNLNHPERQLDLALEALAEIPECRLQECSARYVSTAVGPGRQPDYLNAVARLATALEPEVLLDHLQSIEQAQGRVRAERWGARTLDLDLLLYGDRKLSTARLQVPHPRMTQRAFVLRPLADLAPQLVLPGGERVAELLAACPGPQPARQVP